MTTLAEMAEIAGVPVPVMKPTVGRIVHFYTMAKPPRAPTTLAHSGPYAAIVTELHQAELCVGLTIFPPVGDPFWVRGVRHKDDPAQGSQFWEWPPR